MDILQKDSQICHNATNLGSVKIMFGLEVQIASHKISGTMPNCFKK